MTTIGTARDYPVYSVLGDVYTYLLTGEQTAGEYAVIEALVPVGGGPPPHLHHNMDEAFLVVGGEFEFYVAGETTRVVTGGSVIVPRRTPHNFKSVGSVPGKLIVTVTPAGLEEFFAAVGTRLRDRTDAPVLVTPEHIDKIARLAASYGHEVV